MKSALVLLVHGSPRPSADAELLEVAERVRERGAYDRVEVGYLECQEPDIPTVLDRCAAAGARLVVAVPCFLHTGTHVAEDIPDLLEEARARHPGVEFRLARFLGSSPRLAHILAEHALSVSDP